MSKRLLSALFVLFLIPGFALGESVRTGSHLISTANPHASAAGAEMLAEGGSAVDAAIAAQAVLSLVEPQSSGIGGGGFLLHYEKASGTIRAFDGRETAPKAVDERLFLDPDGKPLDFLEAALGGRAVGTPGVLAMLWKAHQAHGKLPWARLFEPAIRLAEEGFAISPRLHFLLVERAKLYRERGIGLDRLGPAGPYFFTDALEAKPIGHILKNPAYARTLRLIAAEGIEPFYEGEIARDMVATVAENGFGPGALALEDLAAYEARVGEPLCGTYRVWRLCSMGSPSSGGSTMLAILGLLEGFDMKAAGVMTAKSVHLFAEASELAYADRDLYAADADFVAVRLESLFDKDYLAERRKLIDPARAFGRGKAGTPPGITDTGFAPGAGPDGPSTSHMVVVDGDGNVVSFTTTVQITFGSFLMTGGFFLNNQLTDFSFVPEKDGRKVANRVEPGKRPRSSMTPTIVLDADGRMRMAIGSPGGSRIISYVAKTLVGVLDWDLDIQSAIDLGNIVGRDGVLEIERGSNIVALIPELAAMGHDARDRTLNSGLHGLVAAYDEDGTIAYYEGGADPRREGLVLGR
ncbi:MAG: gamma-glutamyltransferase [Rhodothalassiaceae bacterium]